MAVSVRGDSTLHGRVNVRGDGTLHDQVNVRGDDTLHGSQCEGTGGERVP